MLSGISSRAQLSLSPPDQPCFVCLQSGFLVQLPSPLLLLIPLIPFFFLLSYPGRDSHFPPLYIINLIFSHFSSSPPWLPLTAPSDRLHGLCCLLSSSLLAACFPRRDGFPSGASRGRPQLYRVPHQNHCLYGLVDCISGL